jgi:Ion channel
VNQTKRLQSLADRMLTNLTALSYSSLFLLWIGMAIGFALAYFYLSMFFPLHAPSHIADSDSIFIQFCNALYFSVITATSTGYGDIVPVGISKFLASLQSIMALFVFAVLVTKIVSNKQELALEQVHKLTFENIFYSIREGLYIVRRDFDKLMYIANTHKILSEKDWRNLSSAYEQIASVLEEIPTFYKEVNEFYSIDERREVLLQEGMYRTLDRLNEMLDVFTENKIEWYLHSKTCKELQELVQLLHKVHKHWHKVSPYTHKEAFANIIEAQTQLHNRILALKTL